MIFVCEECDDELTAKMIDCSCGKFGKVLAELRGKEKTRSFREKYYSIVGLLDEKIPEVRRIHRFMELVEGEFK